MKVVCVDDLSRHPALKKWRGTITPSVGATYTIREIFTEPRSKKWPDTVFVRLNELVNPKVDTAVGPYECAFAADHFRRVQTRKTDISIFTSMLTGSKQREPV
jgi:hypothetical protein